MVTTNAALGLEPLTESPLTFYLARSTSILYALHGVVLLLASTDLVRYRPLVAALGASNLVFGSIMLGIDVTSGMPWWWTVVEGPTIILAGAALIVLLRHVPVAATGRRQATGADRDVIADRVRAGTTSAATPAGTPAPSPSRETS
jgi:hypothetical protein